MAGSKKDKTNEQTTQAVPATQVAPATPAPTATTPKKQVSPKSQPSSDFSLEETPAQKAARKKREKEIEKLPEELQSMMRIFYALSDLRKEVDAKAWEFTKNAFSSAKDKVGELINSDSDNKVDDQSNLANDDDQSKNTDATASKDDDYSYLDGVSNLFRENTEPTADYRNVDGVSDLFKEDDDMSDDNDNGADPEEDAEESMLEDTAMRPDADDDIANMVGMSDDSNSSSSDLSASSVLQDFDSLASSNSKGSDNSKDNAVSDVVNDATSLISK